MNWIYGAFFISLLFCFLIETSAVYSYDECGVDKPYYSKLFIILYSIPLIFVSAFRNNFIDTADYRGMYISVRESIQAVFDYANQVEKGWLLFLHFLNKFSSDSQLMVIVAAIITVSLFIFFIYRESYDVSLSLLIFVCVFWITTMNGMRQILAGAVMAVAWSIWANNDRTLKHDLLLCSVILLMMTVHKSAVICIPIFFCARGKLFNRKILTIAVISLFMFFVPSVYNFIFDMLLGTSDYADYMHVAVSMGISRFIIYAIPMILIIMYSVLGIREENRNEDIMVWIMNICIVNFCFNILALKMVFFARIGLYLNIFEFVAIPYLVKKCFTKDSIILVKLIMMIVFVFYFYIQIEAYGGYLSKFDLVI